MRNPRPERRSRAIGKTLRGASFSRLTHPPLMFTAAGPRWISSRPTPPPSRSGARANRFELADLLYDDEEVRGDQGIERQHRIHQDQPLVGLLGASPLRPTARRAALLAANDLPRAGYRAPGLARRRALCASPRLRKTAAAPRGAGHTGRLPLGRYREETPHITCGAAIVPAANITPVSEGLI